MPLLDDRNVNDEGLDANGATLVAGQWSAIDASGTIISSGHADESTALAVGGAVKAVEDGGNLWGSSRDIGAVHGKLPVLGETGGQVNRVGYTRVNIEGTIQKLGFHSTFTQESLDFDDDDELITHITREAVRGANEIVEDLIQIDLLEGAGVVMYGGEATATDEITGEDGATPSILTYDMLVKLDTELNNNRCPRDTKIITGSRMVDTKTIPAARSLYVSPEIMYTVLKMKNYHDEKAFVPVHHYAQAGTIMNGERGSVDRFRIIEVPDMLTDEGAGATVTTNDGYRETNGRYDVHNAIVVGKDSFTHVGFQTGGKEVKFKIIMKMPGEKTATLNEPYGETGFYSVKWYYGTLILRSEWIAACKVAVEL